MEDMRLAGVVCLLVGCSFDHGQFNSPRVDGDVVVIDSPSIDGPPGCKTFSTHLDTCTQLVPGDPLTLTGANTYDTDTLTLSTPTMDVVLPNIEITNTDGGYVVVFVSSFTLQTGATLRVVGNTMDRPLGIVATEAVSIAGAIDLTANGAGARDDASCGKQVGQRGADDSGGGSGGGGGAFAGAGGKGGNGDSDGGASTGGDPGEAVTMRPAHVLGGCDGGPGGDGNAADTRGRAGDGGGAIFIASAVSITIPGAGSINAGGAGGAGGKGNGGGGGGGGSGGMIVLESRLVSIAGKLAANGGGGGEGADGADGDLGTTGALSTTRASGGSGNAPEGADGGTGGSSANPAGLAPAQLKKGGGGGGGGGVGFIAIGGSTPVTSGGAVVSPPYQAWP